MQLMIIKMSIVIMSLIESLIKSEISVMSWLMNGLTKIIIYIKK